MESGSSLVRGNAHGLPRRLVAVGLGLLVTVLLFLVMQALIKSDRSPFTDAPTGRIVDFVRLIDDVPIEHELDRPEPPPKVEPPPPAMLRPKYDPAGPLRGVDINDVPEGPTITRPTDIYPVDGEYLPLAMVKPVYPRRAQTRGIEGYVLLEFTVTRTGAVIDPVVVESEPEGIFERAAMDAVRKFKYSPRVVSGEAVDVTEVRSRITFELDDE